MNKKLVFENRNNRVKAYLVYNDGYRDNKIELYQNIKSLERFAKNYAQKNNINVEHKTRISKTMIIYDKGSHILNRYRLYNFKRKINKKGLKKKLIAGTVAISTLVGASIYQNNKNEKQMENIAKQATTENNYKSLSTQLAEVAAQNLNSNEEIVLSNDTQVTEIEQQNIFDYEYEDRSNDERVALASRHEAYFERYGEMYGLDPQLLRSIMCQESGGKHRDYSVNGAAIGGMQIELYWLDKEVKAYNFETQSEEAIIVNYEDLKDFGYNVKVASMLLQYNLNKFDYDIPKAVQGYNFGESNMNYLGDNWMNKRDLIHNGDHEYVEHVFSFLPNGTEVYAIRPDGTKEIVILNNISYSKTK